MYSKRVRAPKIRLSDAKGFVMLIVLFGMISIIGAGIAGYVLSVLISAIGRKPLVRMARTHNWWFRNVFSIVWEAITS